MHSPRITLLSGDNPPPSSTKCLLHASGPQQPSYCKGEKGEIEQKPGREPTSRQLETALNSVLTSTISEKQNFVDQMLGMLIRQRVSKVSDLTPCFVTLPLAPSASSSTLIFTQLFPFSQTSTKEHISVAAAAEESLITQRSVFRSPWECSAQQVTPKSHCWGKQAL